MNNLKFICFVRKLRKRHRKFIDGSHFLGQIDIFIYIYIVKL